MQTTGSQHLSTPNRWCTMLKPTKSVSPHRFAPNGSWSPTKLKPLHRSAEHPKHVANVLPGLPGMLPEIWQERPTAVAANSAWMPSWKMEQTHGADFKRKSLLENIDPIQTRFLFFSAFIKRYQVSTIRNQTKSYWMIQTIKSSQLHLPTAPLKCSLRGEFLCGAVPQPLVSTQQDPRLIHGSGCRRIDCCHDAVSTPPRTNAARAWYVLATSNLLQRLRCLVTTADLLPFATRATPNHRNVASCLGPQNQEQHAILPTSCSF